MPRCKSTPSRCVPDKRYLDSAIVDIVTEIRRWNDIRKTHHFTDDCQVAQMLLDCYDFISGGALTWANKSPPQTIEGALALKQKSAYGQKTLEEIHSLMIPLMIKLPKVDGNENKKGEKGTEEEKVDEKVEEREEEEEKEKVIDTKQDKMDEAGELEKDKEEEQDAEETSPPSDDEFIDISFDFGLLPEKDGELNEIDSVSPRKRQRKSPTGIKLDKRRVRSITELSSKMKSTPEMSPSSPHVNKEQLPNVAIPQDSTVKQPKTCQKVSEIVYECKECLQRFESEASVNKFKEHYRKHLTTEEATMEIRLGKAANILWKCYTCGLAVNNLYTHRKTHYSSFNQPRKCDICSKILGSERSWRNHKTIHVAEKTGTVHTCDVCGKTYQRLILLREHAKRHTDERPFMCLICGKSFIRNPDLSRHMATHDKVKPVKCEHCDRGFSSQEYLKSHLRTHIAEKNFKCDKCEKEFTHRQGLLYHNKSGRCTSL